MERLSVLLEFTVVLVNFPFQAGNLSLLTNTVHDAAFTHKTNCHDENQQKVQEGDHPGIADLVEYGRELDGDAFREGEACEHRRHPEQEQTCHGQLPPGRRNPPQVPADVTRQGDDERKDGEKSGPHGYRS